VTSTVLDVTVLLLCVSASVVALGAADGDRGATRTEVAEVADRIATETVTVRYPSAEAPNTTRTVHATRAELLALVAVGVGGNNGRHPSRAAFESEALSAVKRGIGPRTRIDAEVETRAEGSSNDEVRSESEVQLADSPGGERRWTRNGSAAPTDPRGWRFGSEETDRSLNEATGVGIPWLINRGDRDSGRSEEESRMARTEVPEPIAVGSAPPRGAEVTVAVITHPAPDRSGLTGTVRIVIRRW